MAGLPTKTDLNGTPNEGVFKTAIGELYDYLERAGGFVPTNIEISASVATNDLTVALKTAEGTDPASSDSVQIAFRDQTLTNGNVEIVDFVSAKSITAEAGATFGLDSGEAGYIFVVAAYDGTTKAIGLTRQMPDEGVLHTTTAISTSADSENVIYTPTAMTDAAIRMIGRIKITHGASVWDSAPSEITVHGSRVSAEPLVYTGHVGSDGSTGNDLPAGWSAVRAGSGQYTVTHNLGLSSSTDMHITIEAINATGLYDYLAATSTNDFSPRFRTDAGTLTDTPFFFTATLPHRHR